MASELQKYGELLLVLGTRYRVICPFRDFDGELHEPPEEWIYRGYSFLPYDDGLTLHVTSDSGVEGVIPLCGHRELQANILEAFERYVAPA